MYHSWPVFISLTLYYLSITLCSPTFDKNNIKLVQNKSPVHLTSKRSLESQLWSILNPFNQEITSKGGGLNEINSKFELVQKVAQDLDSEEKEEIVDEINFHDGKRLTSHPFSDYLIWLRSGECPQREDGVSDFFCPSPDKRTGRWTCVNDVQLCDQMRDCPNGEDESPQQCLFYHVIQNQIAKLTQSLIWNARERGF